MAIKPIDIVLASYNGETYLTEQLNSIINADCFSQLINKIIIVDDASTDQTAAIIDNFSKQYTQIQAVINSTQLGVKLNFSKGLSLSTAPFIMLADQDDVWQKNKIELSYQTMLALPQQQPLLVFSDICIVDENLNPICPSYFILKNINKNWHKYFDNLIQQNSVSGCSMLINRPLLDMAMPIPEQAYMHDWWLVLYASAYGHIELIEQPLVLYRQHSRNTIGAVKNGLSQYMIAFTHFYTRFNRSLKHIIQQANHFEQLTNKVNPIQSTGLLALVTLGQGKTLRSIGNFLRGRLYRSHFLANIILLSNIILNRKTLIPKKNNNPD